MKRYALYHAELQPRCCDERVFVAGNGADGIRTHDLEIYSLVVPSTLVMRCFREKIAPTRTIRGRQAR